MLSHNQTKLIQSLKQKKFRDQEHLFIVEGMKSVKDLIQNGFEIAKLYVLEEAADLPSSELISEKEMKKISALKNPSPILAVFKKKQPVKALKKGMRLVLDDVRDPGNLGTLIRLAAWFGVTCIYCSPQTVDMYNPKVVQASMGSFGQVPLVYTELEAVLQMAEAPVLGAFMDGKSIYSSELPIESFLVMGNEAHGISPSIERQISQRIGIPQFAEEKTMESLNVAMATGICLGEIFRQSLKG